MLPSQAVAQSALGWGEAGLAASEQDENRGQVGLGDAQVLSTVRKDYVLGQNKLEAAGLQQPGEKSPPKRYGCIPRAMIWSTPVCRILRHDRSSSALNSRSHSLMAVIRLSIQY